MPILKELHWLPVEQRIHFKILCIIFKLIRHVDSAPSYLTDIVQVCTPSYRTRSCREVILAPFSYKSHGKMTSNQYGDRALSVVAPDLWNNLPSNLRSLTQFNQFKSHLKTYLFKQHFSWLHLFFNNLLIVSIAMCFNCVGGALHSFIGKPFCGLSSATLRLVSSDD